MIRKLIILTLIQFSLLFSQTQIAVVDFEALDVSNNEARALTNRLMIELHRTNKFKVLEREILDKIIEEQKFQLSGCNSDVCLVELGEIANVNQIATGSISKVGDIYSVSARLISVETGELVKTATYDYRGDVGELMLAGMTYIASQLASITPPLVASTETKKVGEVVKSVNNKENLNFLLLSGMNVSELNPEYLKKFNQPSGQKGVGVTSIEKNCEAYNKSIREGYVIMRMGSSMGDLSDISSLEAFENLLSKYHSGDTVTLFIRRNASNAYFTTISVY